MTKLVQNNSVPELNTLLQKSSLSVLNAAIDNAMNSLLHDDDDTILLKINEVEVILFVLSF